MVNGKVIGVIIHLYGQKKLKLLLIIQIQLKMMELFG